MVSIDMPNRTDRIKTTDEITVDSLFNNSLNLRNREIFLLEDITEESVARVVKALLFLDARNKRLITLYINSTGGDVYAAMGLYDVCMNLRSPLRTITFGACMSAATLILLAGTEGKRYAAENTSFMVHESVAEISGKVKDVVSEVNYTKVLEARWQNIFEDRTDLSKKEWDKLCSKDYYFSVDKAIEVGLADKIWKRRR